MSVINGQVHGRKHTPVEPSEINSKGLSTPKGANSTEAPSYGAIKRSGERQAASENKFAVKSVEKPKKKADAKRPAIIAYGKSSGQVLKSASCAPQIGAYRRLWPDKFVYVEVPGQKRQLFGTVREAADYINRYEGYLVVSEDWLSFLLENRYPKYRIYSIGLVKRDFTQKDRQERDAGGRRWDDDE